MTHKRCSGCSKREGRPVVKPISEFHRNLTNTDGYQDRCKACQRRVQVERRAKLKAKHTAAAQPIQSGTESVTLYPADDFEIIEDPMIEAVFAGVPQAAEVAAAAHLAADLPPAPPVNPVQAAYDASAKESAKRDLKREHAALLEENRRLRAQHDAFLQMNRGPEILIYKKPENRRSDSTAVVVASDWHVEEEVVGAAVHGLNEYNLEVAKERAESFFKNSLALASMMGRDTSIRTLVLLKLGDFFSGWIHEELLASTLLAPGDAANFVAGLFISGIEFWLRESPFDIEVDAIPGNHGRMTKQVHLGNPTGTSLETFMYRMVANHFASNPRVKYRVSPQAMLYRGFYEKFVMREIHGYEVKYGGGVGGLTIPLRKALAQWNNPIRADLTVLGHFHQFFDGGDFLVNGSLIGYNTFAQAIKASFEEARQAFFLVHARKGGQKSITAPVWLDDAHKVAPPDMLADSVSPGVAK